MTKETPTPETDAHIKELQRNPEISGCNQTLDFARKLERERDEAREELQQWKMLCAWGGTPEHIDQFIKGQQSRIHQAQDIEETCQQLERERDEAQKQLKRTFDELYEEQQKHGITKAHLTECQMQLKAMREAIREVFSSFADEFASDSAWLLDDRQTAALAKLQPFLP